MSTILLWVGRILIGQFVVRALAGAGLAFISYQGLSGYVEGFLAAWASSVNNLPGNLVQILLLAGLGEAIDIIGSAMLSVAAIKMATAAFRVGAAA
jgi:hypothetical protein